ncbi:MAG: hypothetical protein ABI778_04470, partial [Ignavibacteriota bacterium]
DPLQVVVGELLHKINATVMEGNERAAAILIDQMSKIQQTKEDTRVVEGEKVTGYFVRINGMPAVKTYIASRQVARLFILIGDHRGISLRETHATSADHIVEAAKTIDFDKFEHLERN